MRSGLIVLTLLGCVLTSTSWAAYTIDGGLSDWGVTPFSDWVPNPPAAYIETDNINEYGVVGYYEEYDIEAMYFDHDASNFYFAVVTSYPIGKADLGLDLNEDMTISPHGLVTGLEYAVCLGAPAGEVLGQVLYNPTWVDTTFYNWTGEGYQGSPYQTSGGTPVGSASVAIQHYPGMETEDGTYILEVAVPRNIFPENGGGAGDLVGAHFTTWCGNDVINLVGDLGEVPQVRVPAPGAVVLGGLGVGLLGWLRRRRMLT